MRIIFSKKLILKYQLLQIQAQGDSIFFIMGCCWSNPEIEDSPQKEQSRSPLNSNQNYISSSPQKLNDQETGQSLRQQGNEYFKRKQFALAIQAYSKALSLPNCNIANYSNLALAYKANGQYEESISIVDEMLRQSSFRSYEHAEFFRKAHIIKSRCIIIQVRDYCLSGNYTEKQSQQKLALINSAVHQLEEIISVPNTNQEIQAYLQSGVKIKIFLEEEVLPRSKKQSIVHYLQARFAEVKLQGSILEFYRSQEDIVNEMTVLVQNQMQLALQQPEQFMVDPITYDIFQQPVIVPSGQSYDKSILMQHFKNNGYNDPITHQLYKLGDKVIIRNITLQNYISQMRKGVNKAELDFLKY